VENYSYHLFCLRWATRLEVFLDKRSPAAFEWFPMLCNKTEKWPPIRITIFNLEPGRGATIHPLPRLWRERRTSAAVLRVARDALHKAPCQHAVVE